MTMYEMPADPKRDVWDRAGDKWTYDAEADGYRYGRSRLDGINYSWHHLLNEYGPLTDTRVPDIGETFKTGGNDEYRAEDMPEGAIFANEHVAGVCVGGVFEYSGEDITLTCLYAGEWTRLR